MEGGTLMSIFGDIQIKQLGALISKLRLADEEMLKWELHSDRKRKDCWARIDYWWVGGCYFGDQLCTKLWS